MKYICVTRRIFWSVDYTPLSDNIDFYALQSVQYHATKKNLCCLSFQLTHLVQSLYGCSIIRFDTNDEKLPVDPK